LLKPFQFPPSDSFADASEAALSCGDACLETAAASLDGVVSFVLSKRQTSLDGSALSCAEVGNRPSVRVNRFDDRCEAARWVLSTAARRSAGSIVLVMFFVLCRY